MFLVKQPSKQTIERFILAQRDLPFSYAEVGATRGQLPAGYVHDHNLIQLGTGRQVFERAVVALREWVQFDLGWVKIVPDEMPIATGVTVAIRARTFGLWSLSAARIVYVVNETAALSRFGFAYGTLADHVERGEERFTIEWRETDDSVWYDILAFSRPRHPLVRLGAPLARILQKRFARESLMALAAAVRD